MNGKEIKKLREKLGMTQAALAHVVGVSCGTLNRWENELQKPSPLAVDKLRNIAKEGMTK